MLINIEFINIDGITTNNRQLIAETFNNYVASIAENIKTTDRNAYIQNKNTPDTAIIAISTKHYLSIVGMFFGLLDGTRALVFDC